MSECEACGLNLCEECLRERAVKNELMNEGDAASTESGPTFYCEETGMRLCADCFEEGVD